MELINAQEEQAEEHEKPQNQGGNEIKYFILYISNSPELTQELYINSKSIEHLLDTSGAIPTAASQQVKAISTPIKSSHLRKRNQSPPSQHKQNQIRTLSNLVLDYTFDNTHICPNIRTNKISISGQHNHKQTTSTSEETLKPPMFALIKPVKWSYMVKWK